MYPGFKEAIEKHFSSAEARDWKIYSYFEKDYQLINDYKPSVLANWNRASPSDAAVRWHTNLRHNFIHFAYRAYCVILIGSLAFHMYSIIDPYKRDNYYFKPFGLPMIALYHLFPSLIILLMKN